MKIAFYLHNGEKNGANYCAYFLVKNLTEFEWTVYLKSSGPIETMFNDELNIKTQVIDNPTPSDFHQFDMVLVNTLMNYDVIETLLRMRKNHLWILHESFPLNQEFVDFTNPYQLDCLKNLDKIKRAFEQCQHVIFVADHQRKIYNTYIHHQRFSIIYNGIDQSHFNKTSTQPLPFDIRSKFNIDKNDFLIIQVGTLGERKNQTATIEIARRLNNNFKFLLIGARYVKASEVDYINQLKTLINKHELQNKVQILDVTDAIEKFYLSADVLLCTSLNETLPLSICEAMCFKLPVVSSNVDAIPEIVDTNNGFLHDPHDIDGFCQSLQTLANNKSLRLELGKNGNELVNKKFDFQLMLNLYRATILNLSTNNT